MGRISVCASAVLLLLVNFLNPNNAAAWGRIGHRVAAAMAEDRLTPAARTAVHTILDPDGNLADAATWADEQKDEESYRWHFVNVPLSAVRYEARYCSSKGCVVSKIEDCRRILQNPKAEKIQKQQALRFLIHFIADLHQPLHVGDNNDQGGNRLQVRFFGFGTNLHRVWDSEVIERHTTNEKVWLWDMDFIANPKMAAEWSTGTPEDWATETLQIAKEAYRIPDSREVMRSGARLGNKYYRFALTIVQQQLAKSGIRIAFVLNSIFH